MYSIARHALSLGIDPNAHKLIVVGDWRYAGDDTHTFDRTASGGRP